MNLIKISITLILGLLIISCKPSKEIIEPIKQEGFKIEVLKGDNQKDTLGNLLPDTLVFRITFNGSALKFKRLEIAKPNCNFTRPDNIISEIIGSDDRGIITYKWQLGCNVGVQTLKVYLMDTLNAKVRIDSTNVNATAINANSGLIPVCCIGGVSCFLKLKNNRMLAGASQAIGYSDDNGQTWKASYNDFPLYFYSMIQLQNGYIMAGDGTQQGNGVLLSTDNGQTWQSKKRGMTEPNYIIRLTQLSSGRILAAAFNSNFPLYKSDDNGENWTKTGKGIPLGDKFFNTIIEESDRTLWAVNDVHELYKSIDSGENWFRVILTPTGPSTVGSVFVHSDGSIYASGYSNIYKSIDKGITWVKVFDYNNLEIRSVRQVGDYMYFNIITEGLMRTKDFINIEYLTKDLPYGKQLADYILFDNHILYANTPYNNVFRYLKP
jgi:photosystem II stability/assembly factor-like uncharacterized protein